VATVGTPGKRIIKDPGGTPVNYDFDVMRGRPRHMAPLFKSWDREGCDGHSAAQVGKRGPLFQLRCVKFVAFAESADKTAAEVFMEALNTLRGELVTVHSEWEWKYENVRVAEIPIIEPMVTLKDGVDKLRIEAVFQMRQVA